MRYSNGFTHAGVFHADEVFCTALLQILFPEFTVIRGFKVPENFDGDGIIYDIGLGEFDHHQMNNEVRENGIPYAAFGKVYRHLIPDLKEKFSLSDRAICAIEENLVQPVDSQDNGVEKNLLSETIGGFNPCWNESTDTDTAFSKAVEFATTVLNNAIREQIAIDMAERQVTAACEKAENGIVILDRYMPWIGTVLKYPDLQFCIFPSARGGYNVQTVAGEDRVARCKFPEEWLGKTNPELGITFCHPGNWILSCDTLSHAITVAKLAINEVKEE